MQAPKLEMRISGISKYETNQTAELSSLSKPEQIVLLKSVHGNLPEELEAGRFDFATELFLACADMAEDKLT